MSDVSVRIPYLAWLDRCFYMEKNSLEQPSLLYQWFSLYIICFFDGLLIFCLWISCVPPKAGVKLLLFKAENRVELHS